MPDTVKMQTATFFSSTEEPFSAVPLLCANISPFWIQEAPLVLHRTEYSALGNTFSVIMEVPVVSKTEGLVAVWCIIQTMWRQVPAYAQESSNSCMSIESYTPGQKASQVIYVRTNQLTLLSVPLTMSSDTWREPRSKSGFTLTCLDITMMGWT